MPPKPKTPPPAAEVDDTPKEPEKLIEVGNLTYDHGATYTGEYTMMYPDGKFYVAKPEVVDEPPPDPKTKGKPAKGAPPPDEVEEVPTEDPRRVRHGKGVFKDGAVTYDGEFNNDKYHGLGKFTFVSGATYEGQWENGVFQGQGKYTWADGTSYEGDFVDNCIHGQGHFTDIEGHVWYGEFTNNSGPGLTNALL